MTTPRRRRHWLRTTGPAALARIEHEDRLWHGMKDRYAIVVTRRGGVELLFRGATYRHGPRTIAVKQPGELYRELRRDGPGTYDVVFVEPGVVDAARDAVAPGREIALGEPTLDVRDPRAGALLAFHRRLAAGADADVTEAALALVELATTTTAAGRERPAVRRARAYLLERLAEPVHLDEVADHVRIDKFHLIRAFRAEVGVPPYEFLTHARIHRARELLRHGLAAGAVAPLVGYCDQSQLHRHFVRLTGETPGRYARYARQPQPVPSPGRLDAGVGRFARRP